MLLLGIDFGDSRTGLAVSNALGIATPFYTLFEKSQNKLINSIIAIIEEKNIEKVVLGLPIDSRSAIGERANKTKAFGEKLIQKCNVPVEYYDERYSSKIAQNSLNFIESKNKKQVKDSIAAAIILQGYIDKNSNNK